MVKFQETILDRTFTALPDPTRHAPIARLAEEDVPAGAGIIVTPANASEAWS